MKANLQREMAAAALSGGTGGEPIGQLIRKGLDNYRDVRLALGRCGLAEAVRDLRKAKAGRDYVRVALRRGVTVQIHLAPRGWYKDGSWDQKPMGLVTVLPRVGLYRRYMDPAAASTELAARAGTDVEVALRIVLGIERARKRCYELCEEATRWL